MKIDKHIVRIILITLFVYGNLIAQKASNEMIDSINSISYQALISNLTHSINLFTENLKNAKTNKYVNGEAKSLSNLALVYYLRGNYDKSTQYHLESFEVFSKNNMYKELVDAYGEYGYQLKRRDIKKAVAYMQLAMNLANEKQIPDSLNAKLYDNYGVLKEMQNQADSALYFYKRSLKIKTETKDSVGIPYSLNKIAVLKASQGKFSEAYRYLDVSDRIRNIEKADFGKMENLSFRADFKRLEGKIDESISAYNTCLESALKIEYTYMILYCYENLTNLYKQKGQFEKALESFQHYVEYKDSLNNFETNATVAQLEIAYETEQKNKTITQNQLELKNRNQQLMFAIITVILLILLGIGIYRYQQLKRKRIIREIEYKAKLKNAQLEKKLVDEKLNISRELHDNIGSQLTFLISSLDNITYSEKTNLLVPKLDALKNFSKDALTDLRSTIWAMKQEDGDLEKLIMRISETVQRLNSGLNTTLIKITNNINENFPLNSTQVLNLFRIVQEALQNVIKYSNATHVNIDFYKIDDGFEFSIKDNGNGFNLDAASNGNGLDNMKTRAEQSGGKLNILSSEKGTTIQCKILMQNHS